MHSAALQGLQWVKLNGWVWSRNGSGIGIVIGLGIGYKIGSRWGGHLNPLLDGQRRIYDDGNRFSSCGYLQSFDAGRVMKINDLQ